MDKKYYNNLAVASAPHLVTAMDTSKTMLMVIIALMPSLVVSTIEFGFRHLSLPARACWAITCLLIVRIIR